MRLYRIGCRSRTRARSELSRATLSASRVTAGRRSRYAPLMCGRFTQHLSWAEIHYLADLIGQPRNLAPRFNIAPTTQIEVIRPAAGGNQLVPTSWRLTSSRWKKAKAD